MSEPAFAPLPQTPERALGNLVAADVPVGMVAGDCESVAFSLGDNSDYYDEYRSPRQHCREWIEKARRQASANLNSQWKLLVGGQVLSFLLACTGAAQATLHFDCNLSAPTFTVGLFYFALMFCLVPVWYRHRSSSSNGPTASSVTSCCGSTGAAPYSLFGIVPLQAPPIAYLPMALLDFYANYFTVLAFKYTTITSVTLFDALAIPTAMFLSKCCLGRQYSVVHFAGVFACSVGIGVNVVQDYHDDKNDHNDAHYPYKLKGDFFAVTGGILFGINNTVGELAVRRLGGPDEYLGMLGLYATIICAVQSVLYERNEIAEFFGRGDKSETCSESFALSVLVAYFVSAVCTYLGAARFLQVSEATFFNLSLLTGDLWSVGFSVVAERIVPKPRFFVAMVFIVGGVVVYEMAPTPVLEDRPEVQSAWPDHVELQTSSSSSTDEEDDEKMVSSE